MSYAYTFTDKQDYLLCVTGGEVKDVASLISYSEAIVVETRKLGRSRLLIDDRALTVNLLPLEVAIFGDHLANINFDNTRLRIAVLYSPLNKEISHIFETVLTNRSFSFRAFKERENATEWLSS
ncbi:MAG: hypothetical protein OCC46_02435 [Pseudodesulfovibrio sp.]